jgi:hypothetical protein
MQKNPNPASGMGMLSFRAAYPCRTRVIDWAREISRTSIQTVCRLAIRARCDFYRGATHGHVVLPLRAQLSNNWVEAWWSKRTVSFPRLRAFDNAAAEWNANWAGFSCHPATRITAGRCVSCCHKPSEAMAGVGDFPPRGCRWWVMFSRQHPETPCKARQSHAH